MSRLIAAGRPGDLAEGEKKKVTVDGHEYLLANVSGRLYAADGRCPHLKGDLAAGILEGPVIVCPLQGSKFDIRDGHVVSWRAAPAEADAKAHPLPTYRVRVENNTVYIEI